MQKLPKKGCVSFFSEKKQTKQNKNPEQVSI